MIAKEFKNLCFRSAILADVEFFSVCKYFCNIEILIAKYVCLKERNLIILWNFAKLWAEVWANEIVMHSLLLVVCICMYVYYQSLDKVKSKF